MPEIKRKQELIKGEEKINSFLFSEFSGTLILAMSIGFANVNGDDDPILRRMRAIMGVFIGIYLSKKISGPFLNPAVFVMILDLKQLPLHKKYKFHFLASEFAGGILGAILTYCLNMGRIKPFLVQSNEQIITGCLGEFIASFAFFLLILAHIDPEYFTIKDIIISSWVITAGLACGSSLGSNLSSASMNPAIAFGNCLIGFINTGEFFRIKYVWIYLSFPVLAALMVNQFYVQVMKFGINPYINNDKNEALAVAAFKSGLITKESFRRFSMKILPEEVHPSDVLGEVDYQIQHIEIEFNNYNNNFDFKESFRKRQVRENRIITENPNTYGSPIRIFDHKNSDHDKSNYFCESASRLSIDLKAVDSPKNLNIDQEIIRLKSITHK